MRWTLFVVGLIGCVPMRAQEAPGLVPAPVQLKLIDGACRLDRPWKVTGGPERMIATLGSELAALRSGTVPMSSSEPLTIWLDLDGRDTITTPDHYALNVLPDGI